jgi:transposase-like protein
MKKVTFDEYQAALKTRSQYTEQQQTEIVALRLARQKRIAEMVGDFGDPARLKRWALRQWEIDKAKGIGTGMTDENRVREWYISNLRRDLVKVCDAFDLDLENLQKYRRRVDTADK